MILLDNTTAIATGATAATSQKTKALEIVGILGM